MQLGGQGSRLQRMQFIGTRKRDPRPQDLLDFDQVLVHVIGQRGRIAAVFAHQRIRPPGEILDDRLRTDADDKVPLLRFRRRSGCPLYFYLNEAFHLILWR